MNRRNQTELKKKLRDMGYTGRLEQRGPAWRITVSQIPLVVQPPTKTWRRDEKGRYVTEESPATYHSRPTSAVITAAQLLSWFKENGYSYARVIRVGSSDVVFELDHEHNIWKTLQNL